MHTLLEQLNRAHFWDIDIATMDAEKSKRLIIERIFSYGNLDEIKLIKNYYGLNEIMSILCNLNYIDPKTLNFISLLFQLPKTKFKCFAKNQSTGQPWNY